MKSSGAISVKLSGAARLRWKVLSEGQANNTNYAGRPSVCRNCGALVGAAEASCSMCGTPKDSTNTVAVSGGAPPRPQEQTPAYDPETVRFARAILSRPYIFTIVFLVANVFVFILTAQAGADNDPLVLIRFGAKLNSLINNQHEWWRFVTPIFLHGGIAHILMNMYGLWVIGPYVERLYGSAKFVFFWVATGVAGVVASYLSVQPGIHNTGPVGRFLFKSQDAISVGASGALFGLIGVLFVFGIKFRHELPEGFKRAFGTGMLPTILLNIVIGYMVPVIDNAAHMGGLVAGALLALLVNYKRPGESKGIAVFWHVLQFLALALVVVSFIMVARNFNRPVSVSNHTIAGYLNALNLGQRTLDDALEKDDANGIDAAVKALTDATPPDPTAGALRDELKSLLARAHDLLSATPVKGAKPDNRKQQKEKLNEAFSAWAGKRDHWVETEGQNYGVYIEKSSPEKDPPKGK